MGLIKYSINGTKLLRFNETYSKVNINGIGQI